MNDIPVVERQPRSWLMRRLTPGEYLGLHLTLGVLLVACTLMLFLAIASRVLGENGLTRLDHELGTRLSEQRATEPAVRWFFRQFTDFGGVPFLTSFAIIVALVFFWRRQRQLALIWVGALAGTGLLDTGLKVFFDRDRPLFRDESITEQSKSFPSGHSMGSMVGYGLLAYLLVLALPRRWAWKAVLLLALAVLLIGFSRIYLGAHYLSDVLGGFSIGACWLILFISISELLRAPGQAAATGP